MVQAADKVTLSRWSMTTPPHPDSSSHRTPFLSLHAALYSSTSSPCKPNPSFPLWLYHPIRFPLVSPTPFCLSTLPFLYLSVIVINMCIPYTWFSSVCASAVLDTPTSRWSGLTDPCCIDPRPAGIQHVSTDNGRLNIEQNFEKCVVALLLFTFIVA